MRKSPSGTATTSRDPIEKIDSAISSIDKAMACVAALAGEKPGSLSAAEVCAILNTCKDLAVEELTFRDLVIRFSSRRNEIAPARRNEQADQDHVEDPGVKSEISPQYTREARLMNEEAYADQVESELLISDPLAYEKLQIDRDLERNRGMNGSTAN